MKVRLLRKLRKKAKKDIVVKILDSFESHMVYIYRNETVVWSCSYSIKSVETSITWMLKQFRRQYILDILHKLRLMKKLKYLNSII